MTSFSQSRTANLNFIPQSALVVLRKGGEMNLLDGHYLLSQLVFALVNGREMAFPDFRDNFVLVLKFAVLCLFVELDGPLLDRILAFVVEDLQRFRAI